MEPTKKGTSNLLQTLINLPFGIIVTNNKGTIINANSSFRDGYTKNGNMPLPSLMQDLIAETDREKYNRYLSFKSKNNITAGKKQHNTFELKEGQHECFVEMGKIYDTEQERWLHVGIATHLGYTDAIQKSRDHETDLKNNLKEALEKETELSDMKSRFLSIASHEFRTPLAGILSSLNLINRYLDADRQSWNLFKNREKVTNHLNKINESVKNLTTILNNFLSLGNIQKGKIPVHYTRFNLKEVLTDQQKYFSEISKPGQSILYQHRGEETDVVLDRHLLKNILNNLLSNAIKFSEERSAIHLTSTITDDQVTIEICDQGIGIPAADQKRIFRRFFRAKNALTYKEGTGLGLNIVKKYIEIMKGNITFVSRENSGTTFTITFPEQKL